MKGLKHPDPGAGHTYGILGEINNAKLDRRNFKSQRKAGKYPALFSGGVLYIMRFRREIADA